MEANQLMYNRTPTSASKLQPPQKNKWVSVTFDKTRSIPLQQDNIIHLKGRSTITIKHVLNTICTESFLWSALITSTIWLNFILITYTYIFTRPTAMNFELFPAILMLDILFILDVARSTSIFFGHVKLERRNTDKKDSLMTYLDIFLAFPLDYSLYYFYRHLQSPWFIGFRLIGTLRAYRIYTFFNKYNALIGMHHTFMGIIKFLSMLSFVVHTLTCILYGNIRPLFNDDSEQNHNSKAHMETYFKAMFCAFSTVSHFGYGFVKFKTLMEKIISCIGMLFGYFLINGIFVPTVWNFFYLNLINRIIVCNQKYYILNYLQSITCVGMSSKISKYYHIFWIKKQGINKPEIFNSLNTTFQEDIYFDKNYKFLKNSITFRDFPETYLRRISFLMKHEFYDIGDYVFKQNCVKDKMICVVKGIIDILSFEDSNSPVISFGPGTCISECSLVLRLLSKTAVKASTYLELQVIYREDFYETLTHYPEQFRSILNQISKRISSAQDKLLSDSITPFNTTESTYIEKLKDKSQTKTRINLSLAFVHYKIVSKSNSKSQNRAKINLLWRFIVCILAMYVAIAYPYYICFKKSYPGFLGNIADIVFILDVFVSIFKRGFKIRKKEIIWKTSAALKCLDNPYFYLNLLSSFPFEIFALALSIDSKSKPNFSYLRICLTLKLNRLFKVYKIHLLMKYFEAKLKIKVCFVKIVRILLIYLLAIYWTATILYFMTCYNYSCDLNGWFANKTRQEKKDELLEPLTRNPFALSMYFSSCVLLGIESGDVFPTNKIETVVVGILIFFGLVLRGVVLGIFIAVLSLSQNSKCAFQSKLYKVLSFVKKRSFPDKLKHRLINFYTLQSNCNKNVYLEDLDPIDRLPKFLEKEIRIVECLEALESAKLFSDFDEEFTNWVAYNAKLLTLPPKEVVLYQGSTTKTLYILKKGYCYEKYGNSIYKNHGPSTVFGHNSFLFSIPEQSQVTTSTHCHFVLIDYEVLKMAKIEFPYIMEQIQMAKRNSLAGDVNYDIKMLEYTLYKDYNNNKSKLDGRLKKNIYKLNKASFNNMRQFCKHREDYSRPFLKLGNYQWFKYLLMYFTINPHGLFFKVWTFLRLLIAYAYGILGPIQYIVAPYHSMLHIFLAILDCLTYIDLYLRFHVAFYNSYGYLVTHPYSTACNYFKGPFALDLVLCFPIEWIFYAIWSTSHHKEHSDSEYTDTMKVHALHCGLRLIRMLQLYRIILFVKNCEHELRLKRYILAIFTYFCACLVLLNAWACMLVALNCNYTNEKNGFQDGELNIVFICQAGSWYKSSTFGKFNSFFDVYMAAFYFVSSVSMSIGFGDISPKMFQTLDITTAMIITNWIAITYLVAKIIASAEYNSVKQEDHKKLITYQNKIKELMMYLKNNNISVDIQRQLKNYLHYVWSRSNGTQNLSLLFDVNDSLLQDCFSYLYEDTLRKVPIFRRMGRAFYRTFGQEVKEMYFLKDQYIIRSRDIVDQIYIVKNGKVDFFVSDGDLQFTMGTAGIFGNLTQTKMIIFNGLVIANTNVDLLVITSEAFMAIMNTHPSFKEKLESVIVDDREYYAPPNIELNDSENVMKKNKNGFNVPIFAYHNKFQNILLMKAHIKNWLDFVFVFSAYLNCLLVLYQFSFQDFSVKYILGSVLIDIVFVFKMCLAFNRPVINRFGDTVKKLQSSYFNRKLNRSLDIFINLSSITSYLIFYLPSRNVATAGFTIWRLICLFRIYYLFVFFRKKNKDILADRIGIIICAIFIWLSLLIHTCACIFYIIICPMSTCPKDLWGSIVNTSEPFDMYIASIYFIICIFTSTGRGDIMPRNISEMIFVVILILISTVSNAMVLAELAKGVYMEFRIRYERKVKDIKCYLNCKGIKKYQVNQVVQYLKNIWTYSYGNKIPGIIAELPISIKTDLLWIVYGSTFKESYIFSNIEEPFLRQLVLLLDFQVYFQNDYITRDGTIDERVFFIYKGEVSIVTHYSNQTDVIHDTLHSGDVFGLGQGLFPGVAHHFSFRANAITEVLSLKLENWKHLLDLFPTSKEIIYDRIENIYI